MLGLHLLDSGVAIARDGEALGPSPSPSPSPSIVFGVATPQPGAVALDSYRARPRDVSTNHWARIATDGADAPEALAVASAELRVRFGALPEAVRTEPVMVAVPSGWGGGALSVALGLLRQSGAQVTGFIDAALLAGLRSAGEASLLVFEIGLHHFTATRIDRDSGRWHRRGSRTTRRFGLLALQDVWLQLVSEAMVRRTRFDPLHDAATEQALFDQLMAGAAAAARDGQAEIRIEGRQDAASQAFAVTLTRDQFAARAAEIYRDWLRCAHALRPAGMPMTLVVPARVEALPGFAAELDSFAGCQLHVLGSDEIASAASRWSTASETEGDGSLQMRRQLDSRTVAGLADGLASTAERELVAVRGGAAPTHALYAGRAWSLRSTVLEIGREAAGGIVVPDGAAGVSRLHCSLIDEGGDIVLVDHSRYGCFVNGERVAGRARLRAGDTLRIGDPGIECTLIAVGSG